MSPDDPTGPESLVLRYLRNIDEKLDRTIMRIDDLTARVAAVEAALILCSVTLRCEPLLGRASKGDGPGRPSFEGRA
jgi:hypothetical protein